MTEPAPAADLARRMLRQAVADAKKHGTASSKKQKPRRRLVAHTGGRDPIGIEAVVNQLATDFGWQRPSAGWMLTARWQELAPTELAGRCAPERYDADSRTLHVRPATAAAGTLLRMQAAAVTATLNAAAGAGTVDRIQVLPPGPTRAAAVQEAPAPAEGGKPRFTPTAPRTRDQAAPGYHRALEAAQAAKDHGPTGTDPHQDRRDRDFGDIRNTLREPEHAFTQRHADLEPTPNPHGGNESETARQAAIKRARDERAGRAPAIPTAFQRTA